MADPKWFEEDYYLEQKLAQLQATDKSWANKDVDDVKSAFAAAGLNTLWPMATPNGYPPTLLLT